MRRRVTSPPEPLPEPAKDQTRWNFELDTLTPVLGGGVRPFEPDTVDIVRVPGIRGHLRWWWRALFATTEDLKHPDELLRREASLWGGLPEDGPIRSEAQSSASIASRPPSQGPQRSAVRVCIQVESCSTPEPAGEHRSTRTGRGYGSAAIWRNKRLGYALFPLQQPRGTLRAIANRQPRPESVETRHWRATIKFRAAISLTRDLSATETNEVLATLYMWITFGGLGARTRRGFGAIKLRGSPGGLPPDWERIFSPANTPGSSIPAIRRLLGVGANFRGALLREARLLICKPKTSPGHTSRTRPRPSPSSPNDPHGWIIDQLYQFRQGALGRTRGEERPGRSLWPEANLVRSIATEHLGYTNWQHSPKWPQNGMPRGAFGLPINISFKEPERNDPRPGDDSPIEAMLHPQGATRWPSSLIVRPGLGSSVLVLVLAGPRPGSGVPLALDISLATTGESITANYSDETPDFPPDIEKLRSQAPGDALDAFLAQLRGQADLSCDTNL